MPERVRAAFEKFDTNRSGYLDYRELRNALRHHGMDVSEESATAVLRRYDERPDGRLDVGEFAKVVQDIESAAGRGRKGPTAATGPFVPAGRGKARLEPLKLGTVVPYVAELESPGGGRWDDDHASHAAANDMAGIRRESAVNIYM